MAIPRSTACLFAALTVLPACSAYTIVRQTTPSPFSASTTFHLLPLVVDGMRVNGRPAEDHAQNRSGERLERWLSDLDALRDIFLSELANECRAAGVPLAPDEGSAGAAVRATVTSLATGGISATEVALQVELLDARGQTIDEVRVKENVPAGLFTSQTVALRIRKLAPKLAASVARYLVDRTGR